MKTLENIVELNELKTFALDHLDMELAKTLKITDNDSLEDIFDDTIYNFQQEVFEHFSLEEVETLIERNSISLEWRYLYQIIKLFMLENAIDYIYLELE